MANRLNRYDHISPQSVIALLMVQFWIVMTMGTAFANTDLLVVNVISVKRDLREANVMNVSQISLVTIAMNANQAISITHCVKVCKSSNCFFFAKVNLTHFSISECICDPDGSTSSECGKDNGVCTCKEGFDGIKCHECKPNVVGDKCDKCQPTFFDFPSCQKGLSKLMIHVFLESQNFVIFQNANVILMVQRLWNVEK